MKRIYKGFTLIELLLVLALLAAIAVGGLALFHVRMNNFRIDKTALVMQQWLQAGQNYYVEKGAWPVSFKEIEPYLPTHSENNAWGKKIEIDRKQLANKPLFRIMTTLPDHDDVTDTQARRLANHLPNAEADPLTHSVTAEVAAPYSENANSSGQRIFSIQNFAMPILSKDDLAKKIHLPTEAECPSATSRTHVFYAVADAHFNVSKRVPHLLKAINGLPMNWQQDPKATLSPFLESRAVITHSLSQEAEDPENYRHIGSDGQYANNEGALLAIVTCEKISTNSNLASQNSNYIF